MEEVDILANCLGWRPETLSRQLVGSSQQGPLEGPPQGFKLCFSPHLSLCVRFEAVEGLEAAQMCIRGELLWTDSGTAPGHPSQHGQHTMLPMHLLHLVVLQVALPCPV